MCFCSFPGEFIERSQGLRYAKKCYSRLAAIALSTRGDSGDLPCGSFDFPEGPEKST